MWLVPRLKAFQQDHPDIDIRIDATDAFVDLDTADVDLALRYSVAANLPTQAQRLFGEQFTPVVSPWLLKSGPPLHKAEDLARMPLVAKNLASGDLVEPFSQLRLDSPLAYWLIVGPRNTGRPEVSAFCDWLKAQAAQTHAAAGEAQNVPPAPA